MKIMLLVNEFPPEKIAGTAMATQSLAEHLTAKGWQVCVLVTTSCPEALRHHIAPHGYELRWLKRCPIRGLGWFWRLMQSLHYARKFSPDLIQGQAVSCGFIAGVVGRLLRIPSICYAQGYDVYQSGWLQKKTEIRWGCALPDSCLAVTQNLKAAITDIVDVPVELMPHAFELPGLSESRGDIRARYKIPAQSKLVLNVARLEHFKGHDLLLSAWQACLEKAPDAKLWIVGVGSLQQRLAELTEQLGLQHSVRFFGALRGEEVHALMAAADAFVLSSRSEPFGIVLLEAMAHGLPVVASEVDGIPEVLPPKGETRLVPPDDIHALSQALLETMQSDAFPAAVNQQYAMAFTWQKQVARFEALYQQLIKGSV